MSRTRTALALLIALAAAPAATAQTYSLAETPQPHTFFEYRVKLDLNGEIKVRQADKTLALKEAVTAKHVFVERILEAGSRNMAKKVARYYREAKVAVTVADQKSERILRPERSFVVAQRDGQDLLAYCPQGPLTREELHVTEHLDTLALTGLLPEKAVSVGDSWKVPTEAVQALCHLDGLATQDLACKLDGVKDNAASVSFTGEVNGIENGAAIKLKVQGSYRFDVQNKRLTNLEWKQSDTRDQGPVSPASTVELTTTVERKAIDKDDANDKAWEVGDNSLVPIPTTPTPPESMTQLRYADPQGRFEFLYARDWHVVGRTDSHVVMRLLDKGDFVAQVSMSPRPKAAPGKHMAPEQVRELVTSSWDVEDVKEAKEATTTRKDYWIYHVAASGELSGLKVLQHFYMVAGPEGDQLLMAYTMTLAQASKLGTRDLTLAGNVTFPSSR